jgi:hypothetical protein
MVYIRRFIGSMIGGEGAGGPTARGLILTIRRIDGAVFEAFSAYGP